MYPMVLRKIYKILGNRIVSSCSLNEEKDQLLWDIGDRMPTSDTSAACTSPPGNLNTNPSLGTLIQALIRAPLN
jgi:hypothetical protein